jgi:hypothetical protein
MQASNTDMSLRWLIALCLTACGVAAAAEPAGSIPAAGPTSRVLRAGDSILNIEVVDPPSAARSEELQDWAAEAASAALAAFGRFPLPTATVRIEQRDSRDPSPVPWGQTLRRDGVSVLLFPRPNAGLQELRGDWTAVHEISHLFHPYLGGDGRWLAEGLASYYQNVLRARVGLMTQAQAWTALNAGFGRGRREDSGLALEELSRRHRGTMRVYWAGAAFWLEADLALRREGSSLDAVLSRYSQCCLRGTGEADPRAFIADLDRNGGEGNFGRLYERYAVSREFPSLDDAYRTLGIEAGPEGLKFSPQADATRLRRAIMATRPARESGAP